MYVHMPVHMSVWMCLVCFCIVCVCVCVCVRERERERDVCSVCALRVHTLTKLYK